MPLEYPKNRLKYSIAIAVQRFWPFLNIPLERKPPLTSLPGAEILPGIPFLFPSVEKLRGRGSKMLSAYRRIAVLFRAPFCLADGGAKWF